MIHIIQNVSNLPKTVSSEKRAFEGAFLSVIFCNLSRFEGRVLLRIVRFYPKKFQMTKSAIRFRFALRRSNRRQQLPRRHRGPWPLGMSVLVCLQRSLPSGAFCEIKYSGLAWRGSGCCIADPPLSTIMNPDGGSRESEQGTKRAQCEGLALSSLPVWSGSGWISPDTSESGAPSLSLSLLCFSMHLRFREIDHWTVALAMLWTCLSALAMQSRDFLGYTEASSLSRSWILARALMVFVQIPLLIFKRWFFSFLRLRRLVSLALLIFCTALLMLELTRYVSSLSLSLPALHFLFSPYVLLPRSFLRFSVRARVRTRAQACATRGEYDNTLGQNGAGRELSSLNIPPTRRNPYEAVDAHSRRGNYSTVDFESGLRKSNPVSPLITRFDM